MYPVDNSEMTGNSLPGQTVVNERVGIDVIHCDHVSKRLEWPFIVTLLHTWLIRALFLRGLPGFRENSVFPQTCNIWPESALVCLTPQRPLDPASNLTLRECDFNSPGGRTTNRRVG